MNKDCQKKKENKDCQEKKENKDCQKTKENKDCTTLTIDESVLFKTIDVTGDDDDDDDVVLVNDEEDDVIYIGEDLDAEESIIVIDDDSNIENVTLQNSAATNTSTYVKSRKGGILRQLRWNRSKIANKNNDGVRKCNVPDLSPIPAINNESTNISELPTLVTSTPERNLSVPDYRYVDNKNIILNFISISSEMMTM